MQERIAACAYNRNTFICGWVKLEILDEYIMGSVCNNSSTLKNAVIDANTWKFIVCVVKYSLDSVYCFLIKVIC